MPSVQKPQVASGYHVGQCRFVIYKSQNHWAVFLKKRRCEVSYMCMLGGMESQGGNMPCGTRVQWQRSCPGLQ